MTCPVLDISHQILKRGQRHFEFVMMMIIATPPRSITKPSRLANAKGKQNEHGPQAIYAMN